MGGRAMGKTSKIVALMKPDKKDKKKKPSLHQILVQAYTITKAQ
jgi:hypothetical protein